MGFDPITKTGIITFINGSDANGRPSGNWWLALHENLLRMADTLLPSPISIPSRIDFRERSARDTSYVYTCSNLFTPVTVTSLALPPGESRFSLIDVPGLPVTLNVFGDSLTFRVVYAGPDELIYRSYLEMQTTDATNPVPRIPISAITGRSRPPVCTGDTAYGKPLWGQTADFRLKVIIPVRRWHWPSLNDAVSDGRPHRSGNHCCRRHRTGRGA
jgi:hypothetical protein